MTTTIMAETCSFCAGSLKWTERPEPQDPEVPEEPSSWGPIKPDKGKGNMGSYDPWDSANW